MIGKILPAADGPSSALPSICGSTHVPIGGVPGKLSWYTFGATGDWYITTGGAGCTSRNNQITKYSGTLIPWLESRCFGLCRCHR